MNYSHNIYYSQNQDNPPPYPSAPPSAPPSATSYNAHKDSPPSYDKVSALKKKNARDECYRLYVQEREKSFNEFIISLTDRIEEVVHKTKSPSLQSEDDDIWSSANAKDFVTSQPLYYTDNSINFIGNNSNTRNSSNDSSNFLVFCTACIFLVCIVQSFYCLYRSRNSKLDESKSDFQKSLFSSVTSIAFASLSLSFISGLIVKNPQQYCGLNGKNWVLLNFVLISISVSTVAASVASVLISADNFNAKQIIDDKIDEVLKIQNNEKDKSFWENLSSNITKYNITAYSRMTDKQK